MKTLYVLIGPPAIGKTTWISRYAPQANVISRDDVIERIAHEYGMTYDDAYASPSNDAKEGQLVDGMERFGKVVPSDLKWRPFDFETCQRVHRQAAEELMNTASKHAAGNADVVLDMTNMDKASRAIYTPMFRDHRKVAVVFNFNGDELIAALKKNAEKRAAELAKLGKTKTISGDVIDRMVAAYEPPEATEGFDDIVFYDNSSHLLGLETIRAFARRIIREVVSNSWK